MNLAPLAKSILLENDIKVEDLSKEFVLTERSYEFLKHKIAKLNQKAAKWHVPPIELKVNRVEEKDYGNGIGFIFGPDTAAFKKRYYYVSIIGEPPKVEGYTFIGKVQHTPGGENLLNIAPSSPIKNLPEIYRTAKGKCDVCQQDRERFNTFVLRVDKEDPERFTDKKVGDLIQVGSACLKRFLPGISVDALVGYASMIEMIRNSSGGDDENDVDEYEEYERSGPNAFKGHFNTETLMAYISLVYNIRGKYISKSKSDFENSPTTEEALAALFDRKQQTHIHQMVAKNPNLAKQAKELSVKVVHWMKNHDFNEDAKKNPEMANYFGNLNVVAHAPSISIKNVGYLGGALQSYLYYERMKERTQTAGSTTKKYVGKIGERINFNGLLKFQKSFPNQFSGGTVTLFKFEDLDGNNIHWWANSKIDLAIGQRYSMSGIVKKQEVDKWNNQPTTIVKNARLEKN